MTTARLYVDSESWEIAGAANDKFMPYSNEITVSRGGKTYAKTEAKVKTVTISEVKCDLNEFESIADFFGGCKGGSKKFNVTLAIGEDCDDGFTEYHYLNCLISGEPDFSIFEKTISGFEFSYESRLIKES